MLDEGDDNENDYEEIDESALGDCRGGGLTLINSVTYDAFVQPLRRRLVPPVKKSPSIKALEVPEVPDL